MNFARMAKHLLTSDRQLARAFPASVARRIGEAIEAAEQRHGGEIRFVVEGGLEPGALLRDQTPRERAIELFSQLRVWDTQNNNGVLLYVLLADRAVEIVCDRGINAAAEADAWSAICRATQQAFEQGQFERGALGAIEALAATLERYFPAVHGEPNELADAPLLL